MAAFQQLRERLRVERHTWLVTGAAGFIGSNLVETLLTLDQSVVGLDNFSTGERANLDDVRKCVGAERWNLFQFIEGDIRDLDDCRKACEGAEFILHQAALGSVPRSIQNPLATNQSNIDGFLNMLIAARETGAARFVFAGSSSTYGDHPDLPKIEHRIGKPLSPYAVTKLVNELYADVFGRTYGFQSIGLRYFNVFGRRQNARGAYAAVIPRWVAAMMRDEPIVIHGDGNTTRDFCYIDNAVQANLLAATTQNSGATGEVYNVAIGEQLSLNELFAFLQSNLAGQFPHVRELRPSYTEFRTGDVRHSLADIGKARRLLSYEPTHRVRDGLKQSLGWYIKQFEEART